MGKNYFFSYESPAMRGQLQRNLVLRLLLFRAAEIVTHALVLTFIIGMEFSSFVALPWRDLRTFVGCPRSIRHRQAAPFNTFRFRSARKVTQPRLVFQVSSRFQGPGTIFAIPVIILRHAEACFKFLYIGSTVVAVFQPHRYTRLKGLWNEFKTAFEEAGRVIVTDVYAASEDPIDGINGELFAEDLDGSEYLSGSIGKAHRYRNV